MAASVIKLNTSEASSAVNTIKSRASEAQNIVNALQKNVQNVKNWWAGESAEAFVEEFNTSKKEFDKMIECINQYAKLLSQAIKLQQQMDEDIARQMHR